MFTTQKYGRVYRWWEIGDADPLDCLTVQDERGTYWKRAGDWIHHNAAELQAHGIPPAASRWVTSEGDETYWEDLLEQGPLKEVH